MPKSITETEISDTLIERPISFSLRGRRFFLYQPTLGRVQLTSRLWKKIAPKETAEKVKYFSALLANVKSSRADFLRLLAYCTFQGAECLDENAVLRRIKELHSIDNTDLASLAFSAVSMDKFEEIQRFYGIDKEAERMKQVSSVKDKDKGSISFGGKSVWGTLIDTACERYGWSYQYVLWGISYTNLRLLLADQVKTLFLTEEERRRAGAVAQSRIIKAEDTDALWAFISKQSWS